MWTLVTGFLVMFIAGGLRARRNGVMSGEEFQPHDGHELHDLPMGMLGFYLCGFAFMFGGLGRSARWALCGLNDEFTVTLFGKPFGLLA